MGFPYYEKNTKLVKDFREKKLKQFVMVLIMSQIMKF